MKKIYILLLVLMPLGAQPLIAAQISADEEKLLDAAIGGNIGMVKMLLARGVNKDAVDEQGYTALHCATTSDIVRFLIDSGANKDSADNKGRTPLHFAAENGKFEVVKILLDSEVNIDAADKKGQTPLHLAAENGKGKVVQLLIDNGANARITDKDGNTPLHLAVENDKLGPVFLLNFLFDAKNNKGKTPLDIAQDTKNDTIIRSLNNAALFSAASNGSVDIIKKLLDSGNVDKDASTGNGWTALHFAAKTGNWQVVKLLLDSGVNEGAADKKGQTPLHIAAKTGNGRIVQLLIDNGANAKTIDKDGNTPLHLAVENDKLGPVFLLNFLFDAKNNKGKTPLDIAQDTKNDTIIRSLNNAALFSAASNGSVDIIKKLLDSGNVDKDASTGDGKTALHFAAYHGKAAVADYLIKVGANKDKAESKKSETPLHIAAQNGHAEVVNTLLAAGADATIKNKQGKAALFCLRANNPNAAHIKKALMQHYRDHYRLEEVVIKEKEFPHNGLKRLALFINNDTKNTIGEPVFFAFLCAIHQQASPIIGSQALLNRYITEAGTDFDMDSFGKNWFVYNHAGAPTEELLLLIPTVALTTSQTEDPEKKINLSDLGFDDANLIKLDVQSVVSRAAQQQNDPQPKSPANLPETLSHWLKKDSGPWAICMLGHGLKESIIAGIPTSKFNQLIALLSKNIITYFLFYTTCYGGGVNLITPYLPKSESSSNFIVAQQDTTESVTAGPSGTYDPFSPQINLKEFFKYLDASYVQTPTTSAEKLPTWHKILATINPKIKDRPQCNTPLIKFPGTDFFQASDAEKKVFSLTASRAKAGCIKGKINVPKDSSVMLLYPPITPTTLLIPENTLPIIISMNPEYALHVIEKINSNETFKDPRASMLSHFAWDGWFKGRKIFIIKQWHFPNSVSFSNVVIWNTSGMEYNGSFYSNRTLMAYQQTEHDPAGDITKHFLTSITADAADNIEQKRLDEIKQENEQAPTPLNAKEWSEKVTIHLNNYADYKPKLVNINGELVAPWQAEPAVLAAYAKQELGLPLNDNEKSKAVEAAKADLEEPNNLNTNETAAYKSFEKKRKEFYTRLNKDQKKIDADVTAQLAMDKHKVIKDKLDTDKPLTIEEKAAYKDIHAQARAKHIPDLKQRYDAWTKQLTDEEKAVRTKLKTLSKPSLDEQFNAIIDNLKSRFFVKKKVLAENKPLRVVNSEKDFLVEQPAMPDQEWESIKTTQKVNWKIKATAVPEERHADSSELVAEPAAEDESAT